MRNLRKAVLLGSAMLALAGCSSAADALGLGRNAPDEFAVVDRAPLSLPPDYELRPPKPGAPRPQEVRTPEKAGNVLFGSNSTKTFLTRDADQAAASDSEKALLQAAGTTKAEAGIRDTLDREAAQKVSGSPYLLEELLWWRRDASGTTVDAAAEAERLKEAKEKGESVTAGPSPIIEKGKGGWLGL